jgi:hypothetical protein
MPAPISRVPRSSKLRLGKHALAPRVAVAGLKAYRPVLLEQPGIDAPGEQGRQCRVRAIGRRLAGLAGHAIEHGLDLGAGNLIDRPFVQRVRSLPRCICYPCFALSKIT